MQRNATPPTSWLMLFAAALHAALAFAMVSRVFTADHHALQMTYREQFSDWGTLLRLVDQNATREAILSAAWCDYPRPAGTTLPPFCDCVDAVTRPRNGSVAERGAVVGGCLRRRGAWRVSHSWRIHPATSAFAVLLITACFLLVAAEHPPVPGLWAYGCWGSAGLSLILLAAKDPAYSALWIIAFFSAATSITFVLVPGLREAFASRVYESCFWWAEFFAAPVFAMYAVIYNSGRDLPFALSAIMMGTLLAGSGLRSLWYSVTFAEHPRLAREMQGGASMVALWISAAFAFLAAVYHRPHPTLAMPQASVAMLALTCIIVLLQMADVPRRVAVPLQSLLALARNLTLVGALWRDLQ